MAGSVITHIVHLGVLSLKDIKKFARVSKWGSRTRTWAVWLQICSRTLCCLPWKVGRDPTQCQLPSSNMLCVPLIRGLISQIHKLIFIFLQHHWWWIYWLASPSSTVAISTAAYPLLLLPSIVVIDSRNYIYSGIVSGQAIYGQSTENDLWPTSCLEGR